MKGLIVVDVQRDFCEGGSLAVTGGLQTAWRISSHLMEHGDEYHRIVATKDWHIPQESNGGHFDEWPTHCLQGTRGAELASPLTDEDFDTIFYKGQGRPAYSGFEGKDPFGESMTEYFNGIDDIDVCGVAYDYCVKATAIDAIRLGKSVRILDKLCASIGNPAVVRQDLRDAGARILR